MKISFKIPAVAALGGLVLCAGVLSASANVAASADKAAVMGQDGEYWSEEPTETKYYPENGHSSEGAAVLPDGNTMGVTGTIGTETAVTGQDGEYWSEEPTETKYYPENGHRSEGAAVLPDGNTMGVTGTIGTEAAVIEHDGGYWYFEDIPETRYYPENGHRSETAAISEDGNIISVTPNADTTGSYDEESPYEAPELSTAGIYRGDGRVYPCGETVETACSDIPNTTTKITGQIVAPDGTVYSWDEIVFLTEDEYPDELMPYNEELKRINDEFGTDFKFAIMDFTVDECIDFYLSMSIEEFRDYMINDRRNRD